MKNIKYIFISSLIIFMLAFPCHFIYDIFKLNIISIFFPTNESIFQHMKMIFTTFFIYYVIVYIIRDKLDFNNIFLTNLISVTLTIIFFLVIYIPTYLRYGENMIFTLTLLFAAILFGQTISFNYLKKGYDKYINIISIILIVIIFIIGAYFTFNPLSNFIFWDSLHETYEKVIK